MRHLNGLKHKVLTELKKAFEEHHTDKQIAFSFSIGVFITALPTLGVGLLLFVVLAKVFASISKLALLASVVVLNPLIKPLFWVASINLGAVILTRELAFTRSPETAITYLIVGNLIIAAISSIIAYFFALKAVRKYRAEDVEVVEEIDNVIEEKSKELEDKN